MIPIYTRKLHDSYQWLQSDMWCSKKIPAFHCLYYWINGDDSCISHIIFSRRKRFFLRCCRSWFRKSYKSAAVVTRKRQNKLSMPMSASRDFAPGAKFNQFQPVRWLTTTYWRLTAHACASNATSEFLTYSTWDTMSRYWFRLSLETVGALNKSEPFSFPSEKKRSDGRN